jgi:hypothetical protein
MNQVKSLPGVICLQQDVRHQTFATSHSGGSVRPGVTSFDTSVAFGNQSLVSSIICSWQRNPTNLRQLFQNLQTA